MRDKRWLPPLLCSSAVFLVLILLTAAAGIGLFFGIFAIPWPEGLSLASWPRTFTDDFGSWIEYDGREVRIAETGLARLEEYGMWIQVIDEAGEEIFVYHKPDHVPEAYPASALTELDMSAYAEGYTVFVNSLTDSGEVCSYIIGFPYAVGKYALYYNGEKITRLMPVARVIVSAAFFALVLLVFGYVLWLTRKLAQITGGIKRVSLRDYEPLREKGMFRDIYRALNKMDGDIRESDRIKEEAERARREWIANITHDLKTPLSPVKGYAELLADAAGREGVEPETVCEYGRIILKNVSHLEKLLNDLKLTWQLEAGTVPCQRREVRIVRYLRELAIDIVNDPAFAGRRIEFEDRGFEDCEFEGDGVGFEGDGFGSHGYESHEFEGDKFESHESGEHGQEFLVSIDPDLFRRAVQNIIVNALIHNPPETVVTIAVDKGPAAEALMGLKKASQEEALAGLKDALQAQEDSEGFEKALQGKGALEGFMKSSQEEETAAVISIRDNGVGMDEAAQARLFERYYRGTNTREKTEGSGLGLAIARQIILLHGGEVHVKSELGVGTEFVIVLFRRR